MGKKSNKGNKNKSNRNCDNIVHNDEIATKTLNFSERKDRFLLILALTTGVFFLTFKVFVSLYLKWFKIIYIKQITIFGADFPLSAEHILLTCVITFFTIIGFNILRYCSYELLNFSGQKDISYEEKADNAYKKMIQNSLFYFILSIIITFFTFITFNQIDKLDFIVFMCFILIWPITFFLYLIKKKSFDIKKTYKYLEIRIKKIFIYLAVGLATFSIGIIKMNNIDTTLQVFFSDEGIMSINISSNLESLIPDDINLKILNLDNNETKEIVLSKHNFQKAFSEIIITDLKYESINDNYLYENKNIREWVDLSKNNIEYFYKINLTNHIKQGKNLMLLQYKVNGTNVKIVNSIEYDNFNFSIFKKEFNVKY